MHIRSLILVETVMYIRCKGSPTSMFPTLNHLTPDGVILQFPGKNRKLNWSRNRPYSSTKVTSLKGLRLSWSPRDNIHIFLFIHLSVVHLFCILTAASPRSSPSTPSPNTHPFHTPVLCIHWERGWPPTSITKHGIWSCHKTRHLFLYSGWTRHSSMRNIFPRTNQSIRDSPCSHCQ